MIAAFELWHAKDGITRSFIVIKSQNQVLVSCVKVVVNENRFTGDFGRTFRSISNFNPGDSLFFSLK